MERLKRNAIRCRHCGEVIESTNRHDFRMCKCGCCGVDGGLDYTRRLFVSSPQEDFEELSEYETLE